MANESVRRLPRTLGFWALVAYGIGDILGAGIYSVVGKVASHAGSASWLSFVCALVAAALTALSYAELGSRFPRSGGESYFCQLAFRRQGLALLVGWLVFCSGVVSMATASHAFRGYFTSLMPGMPDGMGSLLPLVFLAFLAGLNFWGMRQSSTANLACTLIEVTGLLIVASVGILFLARQPAVQPPLLEGDVATWSGVFRGGAIAFFAFIGFEDMVNVSEEVRHPKRNLPLAILVALVFAGGLYLVVVVVASRIVPQAELAESGAPLLAVVRRAAPWFPAWVFSLIATFAVANTGLLNFIMGSRLLYGMSNQRLVPALLGRLHPVTQTPHWAIVAIFAMGSLLAVIGNLEGLAGATSFVLLLVFAIVNLSLLVIRARDVRQRRVRTGFRVPWFVPVVGIACTLLLMVFIPPRSLAMVAGLLSLGGALVVGHWLIRRRSEDAEDAGGDAGDAAGAKQEKE